MPQGKALTRILFLIYLALLGLFAYFASVVANFPGEIGVSTWIQSHGSPWLDSLMKAIAFSDESFIVLPIPLIIALGIYLKGWRSESILMVLGSVSGIIIMTLLKRIIARPRPMPELVEILEQASSYSFPSGNAMLYTVYLGILAYILITRLQTKRPKQIALTAFAIILVVLGYSRIYLGAHWLGDIVGGYAYGAAVVIAAIWIWQRLKAKISHDSKSSGL